MIKTILRSTLLILTCLSAACTLKPGPTPGDFPAGPAAWIDAPLDYSSLPQAEYDVISHASDPAGVSAFELSVDGKVVSTDAVGADQAGGSLAHIQQPWQPSAPGIHLLAVRARNAQGSYGPYAYAHVNVGNPTATPPATPTTVPTSTPTATPTAAGPTATGLQNSNCHIGPAGAYKVDGTLFQGKSVPIEGINAARTWVWVRHPNFPDLHCWLSIPIVRINGSLDGLPIIPAPPLPSSPSGSSSGPTASPSRVRPSPVPTSTPIPPAR